jgi:anion-transporting  ArsA/GET3 family ATPase
MAVNESSRLSASLKKESVPVKRLIVNQLLPPSASDCKFCAMKRKVLKLFAILFFHMLELSGELYCSSINKTM